MTQSQLKLLIDTELPSNQSRAITAQKLRKVLYSLVEYFSIEVLSKKYDAASGIGIRNLKDYSLQLIPDKDYVVLQVEREYVNDSILITTSHVLVNEQLALISRIDIEKWHNTTWTPCVNIGDIIGTIRIHRSKIADWQKIRLVYSDVWSNGDSYTGSIFVDI